MGNEIERLRRELALAQEKTEHWRKLALEIADTMDPELETNKPLRPLILLSRIEAMLGGSGVILGNGCPSRTVDTL